MFTIQECTVNAFLKRYKNHEVRINTLSFSQQITIIKGENGCGKSTLLKAMAELIRYDGDIVMSKSVSYMDEQPFLPSDVTLRVFLNGLLKLQKRPNKEILKELCLLFHLSEKIDEPIKALSKGMKTKVNLIQCLMEERDVYLLDEPFSGLDEQSVKKLINYMKKHPKKMYIITSHIFFDTSMIDCEVVYL